MLFNSYEFIFLYLPIILLLYYKLAKFFNCNVAKYFLILASLIFYSYWDISNLPILLFSICVNYLIGHNLQKKRNISLLVIGIIFNIAYLMYFKYTNFIINNFNYFFNTNFVNHYIELPLGISFFTFTQTAYLVDVYRGETKEYTKSDFLLFVTIFPHLIAGPILYHKDIIPQFSFFENYKVNYKNLVYGLIWFIIGLFKKVAIADKLSEYVKVIYSNTASLSTIDAWVGSLAYTLQLYFDFSGYSEMAIGLGLMLNFKLPINFNSPYKSISIIEFWRKWHITLSSFLKNYLYIPLGGNRNGNHLRNIMITMFLGGIWHGAGWTFIFWGILHGVFICINHLWRKFNIYLPVFVSWFITFNCVNIAWILFRSENIYDAVNIILAMFSSDFNCVFFSIKQIIMVLVCLVVVIFLPNVRTIIEEYVKINYKYLFLMIILFFIAFFNMYKNTEFLYFQF